jgi:hypothetical protein
MYLLILADVRLITPSITMGHSKSFNFSKRSRGNLGKKKRLQDIPRWCTLNPRSFSDVSIGTYRTSPIELPPDYCCYYADHHIIVQQLLIIKITRLETHCGF